MNVQRESRQQVLPTRITGRIVEWKGKFGWIVPDQQVSHVEGKKHGGKIFLNVMDVQAEISGVGAPVSFLVYTDGTGLGAMNCMPAQGGPPVQRTIQKTNAPSQFRSPAAKAHAAPQPGGGKGAGKPEGKGAGKPEGNKNKASPNLPRERITDVPTTGEVIKWNSGYGWIRASEPVDHPQAKKDGSIFVGRSDLKGLTKLEPGMLVQFHVFADSSGLGAEECESF